MNSGEFSSLEASDHEKRFFLQKQNSEYQKIRNRSSQIFNLLLSVVSLVVSIGFIQFLSSGDIRVAKLPIDPELANRCTPEAITYSGVTLGGLGEINYTLMGGLLVLTLCLVLEIWHVNSLSQSLPTLRPRNELELYVFDYSDFIDQNRDYIKRAQEYIDAIKQRIYYVSTLVGVIGFLLIQLYFKNALSLLIVDILIVFIGFGLLFYWAIQHFKKDGSGISRYRTHDVSFIFLILFGGMWGYLFTSTYRTFLLIDRLLIC